MLQVTVPPWTTTRRGFPLRFLWAAILPGAPVNVRVDDGSDQATLMGGYTYEL